MSMKDFEAYSDALVPVVKNYVREQILKAADALRIDALERRVAALEEQVAKLLEQRGGD